MASTGTITFNVFTSNARIPVEGATVIIRRQEPPNELLGVRITDRSGQTAPLEIEARDITLGQQPENVVKPWIGLTVHIEHPEYERVLLYGVQIFPGITTVQNVQLIPLRELDPNLDQEQRLDFSPQPLWEGQSYD